jgi:hypothetical protein
MEDLRIECWNKEVGGRCEGARISDSRAWGLILHEVFGTFPARPIGLLHFLFLSEWLIHVTSSAGYPKVTPVWAEIWSALAKREILPLPASLWPRWDPELIREQTTPARGK